MILIVSDITVHLPFSASDHNSLYFILIVNFDGSDNSRLFDMSELYSIRCPDDSDLL